MIVTRTHLLFLLMLALLLLSVARGYIIRSVLPQISDGGRPGFTQIDPGR